MKLNKPLILALAVSGFFAESANADCPIRPDAFICRGDLVYSKSEINGYVTEGVVEGTNPFTRMVSFSSLKDHSQRETLPVNKLAVGKGCLEGYCYRDGASIALWKLPASGSTDGLYGTIVGINPYERKIAIEINSSHLEMRAIEDVAVGYGCVMGICVGDTVVDSEGHEGTAYAVNPFKNQVSFETFDANLGYAYFNHHKVARAEEMTSSRLCIDYDDRARSVLHYPPLDESAYLNPELKFSMKRPIKRN